MLKESDIRPKHLLSDQLDAIEADRKWLLSFTHEFVSVTCPACNTVPSNARIVQKTGFQYAVCGECGTMYMTPRPTAERLREYYRQSANGKYWNDHIFPLSEKPRKKLAGYRVKKIVQEVHMPWRRTLLDIGAGYGTFVAEAKEYFASVTALEPSGATSQSCRDKGFPTIEATIEEADLPAVDIITSFEVIEHLYSPKAFLAKCHKALPDNGWFFLTCPNVLGFDISILGMESRTVGHEHLNYFHPDSLKLLLERTGFEVETLTTPGQLDAEIVRKAILSEEHDLATVDTFLKQVLVDEWDKLGKPFQRFLAKNRLSSHMWVAATKRSI